MRAQLFLLTNMSKNCQKNFDVTFNVILGTVISGETVKKGRYVECKMSFFVHLRGWGQNWVTFSPRSC